jgi:multiple sugar transport system permease protein
MFLLNGQFGLINYLLLRSGLVRAPIDWMVDPSAAIWAVTIAHVWKSYPFFTVMILAGLQAIPQHLYEAATVDGAGRFRQFLDVTLPSLRQVMTIAAVLSLLSSFRDVETILVMTKGGPARLTETLAVRIYNETFEYFDVGASSAMGVAGLVICLLSIIVCFRMLRSEGAR